MSACNDLLDGFRTGRISMRGGLSFYTNQKMLKIIDQAKFVTVFDIFEFISLMLYVSDYILLYLMK